ncbi:hypothetical protein [uncultured Tolumonas sp.]|uniref:hypothetical protein n=1 Tax=uncultured Tolumonas sp. TaxID=263765 RepID=UPI00292E418E|nr:hypothetical protein [uncultured Tolumonas sp.]
MTTALLTIAANGHNFLTFEDYETNQWRLALEWLKGSGFSESRTSIVTIDEGILPSFVRNSVTIAAGFDNWSGNYLLANCEIGDQIIIALARHVSADDHRYKI